MDVHAQYTCNTVAENYLGANIALVNFYFELLSACELRLASNDLASEGSG